MKSFGKFRARGISVTSSLAWAQQPLQRYAQPERTRTLSTLAIVAPAPQERAPRERKPRWVKNLAWGSKFTKLSAAEKREYKRLKMREYRKAAK